MTYKDDAVGVLLSNRSFCYALLGRVFSSFPDKSLFALLDDDFVRDALFLFDQSARSSCLESLRGARAPSLDAARREYTKLMIGPGKLPVSLWESTYACGKPLLFQESTLAVREAYLKEGFRAVGYPHEADDHLATELNFIAALADRAVRAYESGDTESTKLALAAQLQFLEKHLLIWIRKFSDRMNELDGISSFYPSFAALAALVCERDVEVIEELLSSV